jgi:hypothetical protein
MLDDDTDDNSTIQHSCALIAKAAAFAGKRRRSRQIHAGSCGRIARRQECHSVSEIYTGLGPVFGRKTEQQKMNKMKCTINLSGRSLRILHTTTNQK